MRYPREFEAYWKRCKILAETNSFRNYWFDALPEIKRACYNAWRAGRRYEDDFRTKQLDSLGARITYGLQMGDD